MEKKVVYACMHVCINMLKNGENMVKLRSIMLESRVHAPFGKDYGFICTCNKGSTKFPKSNPLRILLGDGTTPGPTMFVGKYRLSVASHVD